MRKTLLLVFLCLLGFSSFSQEIDEAIPVSWSLGIQNRISPIELPPLNLDQIYLEDLVNDRDKSKPWRYGITRELDLDLKNDGTLTVLENGDKLWLIAIRSPEALNLSVNFDDFFIPEGARVQLFSLDGNEFSRVYNDSDNRPSNIFGSWFIAGETIWIEYYQPRSVTDQASLEISGIIHGYRNGNENRSAGANRGINESGACNYDVNCPIGADFDDRKNEVKKSVVLLTLGNGYLCSAVLVNNTLRDKTPYLLTGNHCLENSDPALWSIRFNWMSPNPVCGTEEESIDIQTNFTMSGAELKASNSLSDFVLVELFNEIPTTWDVAFAGWDNRDLLPEFEVGIHHPTGDIMKICRDDSGAVKDIASGTEVWLIKGASAGNGNGWEIGTTESGSSGSPLFNENGRVIGQLYGGESFCEGTANNGEFDVYGRFGISWNSGNTSSTRLSDWLDPNGSGQPYIDTMLNILNIPDNELTGSLDIFPNPATTEITIMNSRYPNLEYQFYTVSGQMLSKGSLSNTMNTISVDSYTKGVYFLRLIDNDSNSEITKKIIIN
ncbi:T9SS type A sorting domain-containing protein [Constantimarinum furrinae]|uniref:Lysyl endopeptidase n=1 Tax=Constantimarinum furrinae TaxID=2562285 RepID=A0A7G8PRJ3_9FLAO|nr:T9SS type A sorting domain-containing protein [Constantimarinum furrinae]QNJ96959.1 Lysyl endopeptidase [Constantimarinum furrinae]